ncbi:MAG: EAL domain-containing protein [Porticoccaceae bacterium]
MTLFRQLIVAVLALFLVLYAGNVVVSLHNTQLLVSEQMRVHAQDTATSLGLSMTQAARDNDVATLDTLFNAISDSGYFQRVFFTDLSGEVVIDRTFPVAIESVPDWFIHFVELAHSEGKASVTSGWIQLGEVTVISHPGQAYLKLWQATLTQLGWFALVTVMVCLLAYGALRIILNPLRLVERQADAICEREFELQETLPRTRELRRVVEAMNRMSSRLKSVFAEQLALINHFRQQSSTDSLTGLSNRSDFDARLNSFVNPETGSHAGALMIIAMQGLDKVNSVVGRAEGNALLKAMADQLQRILEVYPNSLVARRQGPQFGVFVPDVEQEGAEQLAEELFRQVQVVNCSHDECDLYFNMGFSFHPEISNGPEMLSEADVALRQAFSEGVNQWCRFSDVNDGEAPILDKPLNGWRSFLETCIAEQQLALFFQPVFAGDAQTRIGQEIFIRFKNGDDLVSAGVVIPIAERLGLMPRLDLLILENLVNIHRSTALAGKVVVNLSITSIQDNDFLQSLENLLSVNDSLAQVLIVEIAEYSMSVDPGHMRDLQKLLARHGAALAIDHFGLRSAAFGYLGSLPLHHLKIHRSFTRQLEQNPDNQFYINSLRQLAQNSSMQLWVEGVETSAELQQLQEIGVDAMQGYLLGKPLPGDC